MKILKNVAWGIITARGGSKSVPLKNIVPVCGKPLIYYNINAAKKAKTVNRMICSTDSRKIADVAKSYGAEILERPGSLGGDLVPSINVMLNVAETLYEKEGALAEILLLLQPTSIFLTSGQIDATVNALIDNPEAKSSQGVVKVPHQFHAHNQRVLYDNDKYIQFVYEDQRDDIINAKEITSMKTEESYEKWKGFSKQTKPVHYTFGNLIVTRTKSLFEDRTFFGKPSIPIIVPLYNAYDLDTQDDIKLAELMIKNKLVEID